MSALATTETLTGIKRPLNYYGSKWSLADWLIDHFPPHTLYCEPFGGGASVLLQKPPSSVEVYNDLDGAVVTFFRVLRERPDELVRAIELTPFARAEYEASYEDAGDELERARRLYIRSWQGRGGGRAQGRTGWRRSKQPQTQAVNEWNRTDHLYAVARRLKPVHIECRDALSVIREFDAPDTLFYLDPPYPATTRGRWATNAYQHEMSEADHRALSETLHGIRGMALISSYRCDLYDTLYADWRLEMRTATADGGKSAVETLWLNPAAASRSRQKRLIEVLP